MSTIEQQAVPAEPESPEAGLIARLVEEIETDRLELPGFPEAVLRVQRTLQAPDASAEDVVKVLSAEPALAARALQLANSAQFRRGEREITDLRTAVSRLGFNLVRSVAVAFAIRQLRLRETYSANVREQIERTWRDSVSVASISYVLAKHCAAISADQAFLAGLLHVLGRLYLLVRADEHAAADGTRSAPVLDGCHARIGKLILALWKLPDALQHAVEHQDDAEREAAEVSVTDVLIAAKQLAAEPDLDAGACPALARVAAVRGTDPAAVLREQAVELRQLRSALGA